MFNKLLKILLITTLICSLNIQITLCDDGQAERVLYLSFDATIELALENNFDIQLAKYDAYVKREDLGAAESVFDTLLTAKIGYTNDQLARSSSLAGTKSKTNDYNFGIFKKLPTGTELDIDFTNQRSWSDSSYVAVNPSYEPKAKIAITQPIAKNFFGLIDRGDIKITKFDIEKSDYTNLDKIEGYIADVQKAYLELILAYEAFEIKKEMLDRAEHLCNINSDKLKRGLIENPEFLASRANLDLRKVDLLLAENQIKTAGNTLRLHLNIENDVEIKPSDNFKDKLADLSFDECVAIAVEYRRDYKKANVNVESKKLNLVLKENNKWPEINLEASFVKNGIGKQYNDALGQLTNDNKKEVYIGLTFSYPLENRSAKSKLNKAKLEKAKALVELKKIERKVVVDIDEKVRNYNVLKEKLEQQKKIENLQAQKLEGEGLRFKFGRSDSDTLIRYQQDLLDAKIASLGAAQDAEKALIEVKLAQDSLLDEVWEGKL